MKWKILSLASFATAAFGVKAASISVVNVSVDQTIEAPRWAYDDSAKIKGTPLIMLMAEAKRAAFAKDRVKCLSAIQKTYALGKSLGPWLVYNHLQCALLRDKAGKVSPAALSVALQKLEMQPSWLLFGPYVPALRQSYAQGLLALAEYQGKSDRRLAWKTIDKLQQVRGWMNSEDRANIYRWAGELAFIEQNLVAAQEFLNRSLNEKDSAEVRARIDSIRLSLLGKKKEKPSSATAPAVKISPDLGVTDDEKEIYSRMSRAFGSQDYVSAVEDGISLVQKFSGSRHAAEATERILDIYVSLATKTDEKYRNVRESIVKEMCKADPVRLARWANNAYAKGNYTDALTMSEKAFAKSQGQPEAMRTLLLAAKSALASGEYSTAEDHFEQLMKEGAGTSEAAEATFRLGLLSYRLKKYSQAAGFFERVLALSSNSDFEYRALYWRWRAQQKIDAQKADSYAHALIEKYPLSYYGLRAQAEVNHGVVQLPSKPYSAKIEMRLLESEHLAWERLQILLKAGWLKEAEKELEALPEPQSDEERIMRARLWAAALRQDQASSLMNKVFDEDPSLARLPLIKIIYTFEFQDAVVKESKGSGVAKEWLYSLIRQESSFRPDVRSPSSAMGLMQLLPSTGQEIAKDLRIKNYENPESLFTPDINIRVGAVYMSRLFKNFGGNIPLALAAYNTGPARVRRWLAARKGLNLTEGAQTSSPEVEVWIDELPWEETSYYVKSILRNWMIYRLLDGSKLSLSEPIWVDAKATSR